jgi:probable rRNA maturation factor
VVRRPAVRARVTARAREPATRRRVSPRRAGGAALHPGSSRSVYLPPWRVDLTVRAGVPRLLPATKLAHLAARALEAAGAPRPASIGLILTDDRELTELNATHMGVRGPTDVLSFPLLSPVAFPAHAGASARNEVGSGGHETRRAFALPPGARPHLGDVVVSVERAIDQAEGGNGGWTGNQRGAPADELALLLTHGVLHVCGWDHAEPVEAVAMRRLEADLLEREAPPG